MVLFLRYDKALTYADCNYIMHEEQRLQSEYQVPSILLTNHGLKAQKDSWTND